MKTELVVMLIFVAVAVLSWFSVGRLINSLTKRDIVDHPNDRTLHQGAVPRGGGLAIVAILLLAMLFYAIVSVRPVFFVMLALLTASWALLSWFDDKHDLSARIRIIVQAAIAAISVAAFGWVAQIAGLSLGWVGAIVSTFGIIWMANLFNFMDGMDGLAGSQAIIASLSLAFWFYISGDSQLAMICVVLCAACYGFLLWNWSPAKIFMGDVGSITLGAFFGTLIVIGASRHDISVLSFIGLFGVFIFDATLTFLLRLIRGEKVWEAHRQHNYQQLATAGYSHTKIVFGEIVLMSLCSLLATLGLVYHDMITLSLAAIVLMLVLSLICVKWLITRAKHLGN